MTPAIDWLPSASITVLRQRAQMMQRIRDFFFARDVLEVETPCMARFGVTDRYLRNLNVSFRGHAYALQTSPEYHMKRLLAAGSGPIFQIARAFRDDELGRWHNPEFSLLEWYRLDWDHLRLLREVDELLQTVIACPPLEVRSYQQVFLDSCAVDPLQASFDELNCVLRRFDLHHVLSADECSVDEALFLLMTHVVEPSLTSNDHPIAVVDFPGSQASLARVKEGVAQRFEVYYRGIELANGFYELTDAEAQAERFATDNQARVAAGLGTAPVDTYLLAALTHGLPNCSGVALGLDRLLALMLQQERIAQVMSFDVTRA